MSAKDIRVYELAKELNFKSSAELVEKLRELKIDVKSHMSVLNENTAALARDKFGEKKTEESPEKLKKTFEVEQAQQEEKGQDQRRKKISARDKRMIGTIGKRKVFGLKEEQPQEKTARIYDGITVAELAKQLQLEPAALIKEVIQLGVMATINHRLGMVVAETVAEEHGFKVEQADFQSELIQSGDEEEEKLQSCFPVVTVMGHADHGKTLLLDTVRKADVASGEKGGMTQSIGAYYVRRPEGSIIFVDTPGQEAFTAMRARGSQIADIVVLVVAADDGVMPQTKEAIDHVREAEVEIIIAVNKTDLPNADGARVRRQLSEYGLATEGFGGNISCIEVSAKTGEGVDKLLEEIILQAEMMELKANVAGRGIGIVIDSYLDRGRGPMVDLLVVSGKLQVADDFVVGQSFGRIKGMIDAEGREIAEAGPVTPVEVLGLNSVVQAGDKLQVVTDAKTARRISNQRKELVRERRGQPSRQLTLDSFSQQIEEGKIKEFKLVIKADTDGAVGALRDALEKLSGQQVKLKVIRGGVGPVTVSDIMLAAASQALVIAFNSTQEVKSREAARQEGVEVREYEVIFKVVDEVHAAMEGMLEPVTSYNILGKVEVKQIFHSSKAGCVAGGLVGEGRVRRGELIRVYRGEKKVHEGKLESLRRFQDDTAEVVQGLECGFLVTGMRNLKPGDLIESIEVKETKQTLKPNATE